MLTHSDGLVAHIQTGYNNIFIIKRRAFLFLTTRFRREDRIQSVVNLKDPDDMMAPYTRIVSVALVYPETIQRILMVGLGAGSISTYIGRAMPDVHIDAVEVDPGVIAAGRRYFGLKETGRVRFIESDGRTYLNRHKELATTSFCWMHFESLVFHPICARATFTRSLKSTGDSRSCGL